MQGYEVIGQRILALGIEAQGALAGRLQNCFGLRVPTGEQRNLVPLSNQFFRQIRHYSLSASIQLRWAALMQRRDLCDPHIPAPPKLSARSKRIGSSESSSAHASRTAFCTSSSLRRRLRKRERSSSNPRDDGSRGAGGSASASSRPICVR